MRASAPTSRNPSSCSIRVLYGLCGEEREFEFPLQKLDHEKNGREGEKHKHVYEAPLVRALLDKVAAWQQVPACLLRWRVYCAAKGAGAQSRDGTEGVSTDDDVNDHEHDSDSVADSTDNLIEGHDQVVDNTCQEPDADPGEDEPMSSGSLFGFHNLVPVAALPADSVGDRLNIRNYNREDEEELFANVVYDKTVEKRRETRLDLQGVRVVFAADKVDSDRVRERTESEHGTTRPGQCARVLSEQVEDPDELHERPQGTSLESLGVDIVYHFFLACPSLEDLVWDEAFRSSMKSSGSNRSSKTSTSLPAAKEREEDLRDSISPRGSDGKNDDGFAGTSCSTTDDDDEISRRAAETEMERAAAVMGRALSPTRPSSILSLAVWRQVAQRGFGGCCAFLFLRLHEDCPFLGFDEEKMQLTDLPQWVQLLEANCELYAAQESGPASEAKTWRRARYLIQTMARR